MRKIILFVGILLLATMSFAQTTVKGRVIDETGQSIPGVSVLEQGTTNGVTTNVDGTYQLNVKNDAKLLFSFVGMIEQTVVVDERTWIQVVMKESISALDEIVVVGYGVQKKSDITGAVASVDYKDLETQPINTVDDALKGRVAGVQVVSNSGAPGGSIAIRVRGVGTVNNADPLYVVDGVPVSDIGFLNPNDVASIEVLKDASSSAIYGSRGANGVVLLTTKSGRLNMPTKVSFDGYLGTKKMINNWATTSGSEWYSIQETLNTTRADALDLSKVDKSINTNWFDEISQTATVQDYNVNVSGGTEKLTYLLGGGYYDEEGTIIGSDFNRVSARMKGDYQVKDYLKIGANVNMQDSKKHSISEGSYTTGTVNTAIKIEPVIPVWQDKANGVYDYSKYTDYPNPVAQIAYNNYESKKFKLLGNVYAEVEPIKNLKFKSSYALNRSVTDTYNFTPVYFVNTNQQNSVNQVDRGYYKSEYITWENTLSYTRQINKHNISALYGFVRERSRYEWMAGSTQNIPNEDPALWYLSAGADGDAVEGSAAEYTLMSYLGRINYSYDDKYLLTASFRADGSSRFSDGNKWGYFPSVALGWKISNEEFLKDVDWLSSLKLRAGWGQIGNQNIGVYPYQSTVSGSPQYRYVFGANEDVYQGYVVTGMTDPNIKWETVESLNFGVDASFLDHRLDVSVDWYNKDTKDMLLVSPIPYYFGYEKGPTVNIGSVNNKGFEFSTTWKDNVTDDFSYNIGFNISTYKNEVTSLGASGTLSGGKYKGGYSTRTEVGKSIGYFYGYKTAGVFQTQEEIDNWAKQQGTNNEGLEPGDLKFVDVNEDGAVSAADKTEIGSPDPDFIYGVNLGINYKNWELSAFLQGSQGNEIFNSMKYHLYQFDETNKSTDMLNAWTPTNTDTNVPRLDGNDVNDTNRISDRYVEDGSYLRLKNITLAYNLPQSILDKVKLNAVKFYFSGQNLLTATNYSGADPEVGQASSTKYLGRGVDLGTYPQAKTLVFGVKLDF